MIEKFLLYCWNVIVEAAPYVVFGTFIAGVVRSFLREDILKRWFAKPTIGSVFRATLVGVPLPLCSCSVIPVAMELRKSGANRGATSAFLISTPESGVDSFFLTLGIMNPVMAFGRVIGAFITGITAGVLQLWIGGEEKQEPAVAAVKSCCASKKSCGDEHIPVTQPRGILARLKEGQQYAFLDLLPSMVNYYIIGIIATALVLMMLPDNFLANYVGGGLLGMIIVSLVGVVSYICASAATPLVAALIAKGMSPGTALTLLLAGPATSLASIAAVRAMLGNRGVIIYLGSIIVCAISLGLCLDFAIIKYGLEFAIPPVDHQHAHGSHFFTAIAIALVAFLAIVKLVPLAKKLMGRKSSDPHAGHDHSMPHKAHH